MDSGSVATGFENPNFTTINPTIITMPRISVTIRVVTRSRNLRNWGGSSGKVSLSVFPMSPLSSKLHLTLPIGTPPRLDKALARAVPEDVTLSRSRLQQLIEQGAVSHDGVIATSVKAPVEAGEVWQVILPAPEELDVTPENIPLDIVWEDAHLIVVNKPAGMVVHPAPGSPSGTLVNALLYHCGDSLSGIGGTKRPGIVHRIDKDTSGLLVVAKSDAAHQGLADQFARHSADRRYLALCWGMPSRADPRLAGVAGVSFEPDAIRISGNIARHPHDRKRMTVVRDAGRHAITRVRLRESFGPKDRPVVSLISCQLETGRTHQIRVHLSFAGHALIGDPVYGRPRAVAKGAFEPAVIDRLRHFPRQALHAETLGFVHPVTDEVLSFTVDIPSDINSLLTLLRQAKS